MAVWRLAAVIAIAGIAVVFQFFIRNSTPTDIIGTTTLDSTDQTCRSIRRSISSKSKVYYPGANEYYEDNAHWIPNADQSSRCSVEPGTVADVQQIMTVLKDSSAQFAIKSGGYTFNRGWSSTIGVQIALIRLNEVSFDPSKNAVTVGMGNTWNRVFGILEKQGITVSGGRIDGVGVGGFLLGGGYSYLTDESGLSMDNVISYQVVLPNATVVTASSTSYSDLFWGLKGGFNNFGIVTSAVLKAYPIGKVYGGEMNFTGSALPLLAEAIEKFTLMQNSTEAVKKGGIIMAYVVGGPNPPLAIVQLFYNGVNPPERMLAPFKDIPGSKSLKVHDTLTGLINYMSPLFQNPGQNRAASSTASVYRITAPIILQFWQIIHDLHTNWKESKLAVVMFEPFVPSSIVRPLSDGLFPHATFASPLNAALWWGNDRTQDARGFKYLNAATNEFEKILKADGQPVDQMALYPNYADTSHTVEQLYGPNLAKGIEVREIYDPSNVMLRAGGWKLRWRTLEDEHGGQSDSL